MVLSYNIGLISITKVKLMTFLLLIYLRSQEVLLAVGAVHGDTGCRYALPNYSFPDPSTCLNPDLLVLVCFLVTESHHVTEAGLELAM